MIKATTIYRGSSGLNTVDPPTRLTITDGVAELQDAVNVTIDKSGRVQTRRQVTEILSGDFHSIFCAGADCFVVKDQTLYKFNTDETLTSIRTELTDAKMDYVQHGDRTYYSNGYEYGIIYNGAHVDWIESTYTGVETTREFSGPFASNHMAEFFGKLLLAVDNVLWWSELYDFGLFDLAKSYLQFQSNIRMIKPVDTGLFLSTENHIYFLIGRDLNNITQWRKLSGFAAVEWTDVLFDGYIINAQLPGQYVAWASEKGVIIGAPDGTITNLTERKVLYPETITTGFGGLLGTNFIYGLNN